MRRAPASPRRRARITPLSAATTAASAIRYDRLHLSPVALDLGVFQLRWYALSYIAMILLGGGICCG